MPPLLDGSASLLASSGASGQVTLTTTGAGVVAVAILYNRNFGTTISSITDTAGLTYTQVGHFYDGGIALMDLWYATSTGAQTSDVITVTPADSVDYLTIHAWGISGTHATTPLDSNGSNPDVDVASPRTISTTAANTMVVGLFRGDTPTGSAGTGFTQILGATGAGYMVTQYAVFSSPQTSLSVPGDPLMTVNGAIAAAFVGASGSTTAYSDATTRTRLAVRAFLDAALRLRLSAGAYRDGAVRLRLQVGSYRDAAARFRLISGIYRDAATRVRLSAAAYKDAGVRFLLQLGEQIARPTADVSNDNWTTDTGATTNLYEAIDEVSANDADYIQSSPSPTDWEEYQTRLGDLLDPGLTTGHAIRVRFQKSATGGDRIDLRIRLYRADGVTVITETGYADIDALQTFEFALSEPNADAIPYADYPDLVLGIASRENNGAGGSAGPWL